MLIYVGNFNVGKDVSLRRGNRLHIDLEEIKEISRVQETSSPSSRHSLVVAPGFRSVRSRQGITFGMRGRM
jgi:hypothetical protein